MEAQKRAKSLARELKAYTQDMLGRQQGLETSAGQAWSGDRAHQASPTVNVSEAGPSSGLPQPQAPPPSPLEKSLATRLREEGNTHFKAGRLAQAEAKYSDSLCAAPSAAAFANRAAVALKRHAWRQAVADSTSALSLDSTFVKAYHRRATALEALEDFERAAADFEWVYRLDPGGAGTALQARARCLGKAISSRPELAAAVRTPVAIPACQAEAGGAHQAPTPRTADSSSGAASFKGSPCFGASVEATTNRSGVVMEVLPPGGVELTERVTHRKQPGPVLGQIQDAGVRIVAYSDPSEAAAGPPPLDTGMFVTATTADEPATAVTAGESALVTTTAESATAEAATTTGESATAEEATTTGESATAEAAKTTRDPSTAEAAKTTRDPSTATARENGIVSGHNGKREINSGAAVGARPCANRVASTTIPTDPGLTTTDVMMPGKGELAATTADPNSMPTTSPAGSAVPMPDDPLPAPPVSKLLIPKTGMAFERAWRASRARPADRLALLRAVGPEALPGLLTHALDAAMLRDATLCLLSSGPDARDLLHALARTPRFPLMVMAMSTRERTTLAAAWNAAQAPLADDLQLKKLYGIAG